MAKPVRKFLKRALGMAILSTALAWTVDWLILRHKVTTDSGAFEEVMVRRRYAVHLKNRQIEQRNEQPHPEECINSLFPHYDELPCWYLKRHANDNEDLDGGAWHFWSDDRP